MLGAAGGGSYLAGWKRGVEGFRVALMYINQPSGPPYSLREGVVDMSDLDMVLTKVQGRYKGTRFPQLMWLERCTKPEQALGRHALMLHNGTRT